MTIRYDAFGAPITSTVHEPMVESYGRGYSPPTPAELTVTCTCGEWEFFSQESAGGGLEAWGDDFQTHVERAENGDPES